MVAPLVVSVPVKVTVGTAETRRREHQAHRSEAHLDNCHQLKLDDSASEVKLRWLFVQGAVQHASRNVARHSVASHEIAGHVEFSQAIPVVSEHLVTVP